MKMNLDMSFEEGMNVIEALRECAIESGWSENDLDKCGVVEEYAYAVDAALTAMGINISIDVNPSCEDEDEDEDFDEDDFNFDFDDEEDEDEEEDDNVVYSLTPKGEFVARALDAGISFEDTCELADILFDDNEGE